MRMKAILKEVLSATTSYGRFVSPIEALRIDRSPPFKVGETIFLGKAFAFPHGPSFLHSVKEIFVDEVYFYTPNGERPHIIDAGANMGLSILYFKKLVPGAVIDAFEPDPEIFNLLKKNIMSAGLSDVALHQEAVWIEDAELTFYSEGALSGSSEVEVNKKGSSYAVKAVRLRDFIGDKKVDFLKIDIEGAENSLLFDLEDALANVQNLFIEYHSIVGKQQKLGDILNLLARCGFRYVINSAYGPRHPFVDRQKFGFDTQLNISCFRAPL